MNILMDLTFSENGFVVVWMARDIYGQSNAIPAVCSEVKMGVAVQLGNAGGAGGGGFSLIAQGNTNLKGGAITSTQAGIDNNKNTLTTGYFVVRHQSR